jgi:MFS family permease
LLLLPASVAIAVLLPIAGKWADKHGPRYIIIAGLLY